MWSIRVLSGVREGDIIPLREGQTVLGRASTVDVQLKTPGVSKTHCKLQVQNGQLIITDLNSSNGSFVNGMQVKTAVLKNGDKISLHDVLIQVEYAVMPSQGYASGPAYSAGPQGGGQQVQWQEGSAAPNMYQDAGNYPQEQGGAYAQDNPYGQASASGQQQRVAAPQTFTDSVDLYVESTVMPLIYKFAETTDMRWVLGTFVMIYIFVVTALSVVPMIALTKSSIENESQRRAITIARSIKALNKGAVQANQLTAVSVKNALREKGVKAAMIVSAKDGSIIAPRTRVGSYSKHPFVSIAKKYEDEHVENLNDNEIGASVPIRVYDQDAGKTAIGAYSIVIYDMAELAIDDGQTVSLFVQTLGIALLVGYILYFLLYRLIEKPVKQLNAQVDKALKDNTYTLKNRFEFEPIKPLILNINSILSRMGSDNSESGGGGNYVDRNSEAMNLVQMIGLPAIAINANNIIVDCNSAFENFGFSSAGLRNQDLEALNDNSMILNFQDLIQRCKESPQMIAQDQIPLSGINYDISAQAISSSEGPEFFIFILQSEGGDL